MHLSSEGYLGTTLQVLMWCLQDIISNTLNITNLHKGVDNGAAGAAVAAPIIWLVVVIQK